MLNDEEEVAALPIMEAPPRKGRKKTADPAKWKKNVEKQKRYKPKRLPKKPICNHPARDTYQCDEISMQDVRKFHELFYLKATKQYQDQIIISHIKIQSTVPREKPTKKSQITTFYVPTTSDGRRCQKKVCRNVFLNILGIKKDRVHLLCKKFLLQQDFTKEKRGGDTKSIKYKDDRLHVKTFIESLNCVQSHYNRNKTLTTVRYYLPSELNVKILHKMYNETHCNNKVNFLYFYRIFVKDYNIGFNSPASDACSTCIQYNEEIKINCNNGEKKKSLETQLYVHKAKAASFYSHLKSEEKDTLTLSFDCQKNLVLPKLPDQSVYYSRQLYFYNFTVCFGSSKSPRNANNTFSYVWTECDYPKGSNEIASAVFDVLNTIKNSDDDCFKGLKKLNLFADGCGGQNKNTIMVTMLSHWQATMANPPEIQLVFPVVGHSFMPPDRVFGIFEKEIRKRNTVITSDEYIKIMEKHSTIRYLGKDCEVYNFRDLSKDLVKIPGNWHFQFQKMKRFIINKEQKGPKTLFHVRGEPNYNIDVGMGKSVLKKGKTFKKKPEIIRKGNNIKPEKLEDVKKLLIKHFGDSWENNSALIFYSNLFRRNIEDQNSNNNEDDLNDIIIYEENDEDEDVKNYYQTIPCITDEIIGEEKPVSLEEIDILQELNLTFNDVQDVSINNEDNQNINIITEKDILQAPFIVL